MKYPQRKCLYCPRKVRTNCKCNLSIALCVKCISIQINDIEKLYSKDWPKSFFFWSLLSLDFSRRSHKSQFTRKRSLVFFVCKLRRKIRFVWKCISCSKKVLNSGFVQVILSKRLYSNVFQTISRHKRVRNT